jgi:hypothetical protein
MLTIGVSPTLLPNCSLAALESSGSYASTIACQCPVAAHHLTPGYGLPVFLPVEEGSAPEVVTSLQIVVMRQVSQRD